MDTESLKKFKEDLLPVEKLEIVWPDAQQPFVPGHAKSITETFNWELVGEIIVCGPFKNGKYHICDGQHRVAAVRVVCGDKETVPCRIYPGLDKAHAAWIFNQINMRRRRPRKVDLFKTAIAFKQEPEFSINKAVHAAGFSIGPGHLMGVGALENIFGLGGAALLGQTLVALRETWGQEAAKTADASVIRIFGGFIKAYEDASIARLCACVEKQFTLGRFMGAIKSISDMERISTTQAGIRMLVRAYNTGLRVGRLES